MFFVDLRRSLGACSHYCNNSTTEMISREPCDPEALFSPVLYGTGLSPLTEIFEG